MPSPKDRIHHSALVQELFPLTHRKFVIDAVNPALAIIEIGETSFCRNVVAVLRPGRIATDFWLVIDGLAECERTQEIKAMASPLFCLQLKRMINRASAILD